MTTDDPTRPVPALDQPLAPEPGATAVVPHEPTPAATSWSARGPRMRTLVLGLVLLAVSVTTSIRLLTDIHVDDGVVLLVLLLVAGALLLGGGVLGAAREARSPRD
jgi:hypothetical protein